MITAVILSKNEQKTISGCMRSLGFCDEILVIDDFSVDKTREIAKTFGAEVIRHKLGNFSHQRNFALGLAKNSWVLFVDADEVVPKALAEEITKTLRVTNKMGFYIRRFDYLWGRRLNHGGTAGVKLLRLARRGSGKWQRLVHETWKVRGRVGVLTNNLNHYPHQSVSEYFAHINFQTDLHALANFKAAKRANLAIILFFPFVKFVNGFVLKLGFLDGARGFVSEMLSCIHSYLAWSKLWLLQRKTTN